MSSNLERICMVDIAIESNISNDASFDNCLILGPAPAAPKGEILDVFVVNALEELTELGFVATGNNADPVGVAARVAFSQSPKPHEVYVACIPAASVVAGEGDEATGTETAVPARASVADVLTKALGSNGWYCICPVGLTREQVKEVIEWTETQNKLCGYIDDDPDNPIAQAGIYMRSYPAYPKVTPEQADADVPLENKYGMAVAMAVKAMNYHAGSETWALKPLAAVTPSRLTNAAINKMKAANFNYVLTVASKDVTQGGKTNSGEWIDIVRFRDWLQNDMQTRVVNLLVTHKGKLPYTDGGLSLVENQMISSLKDGQRYGGIAPTEYDEDGNEIPGFVTHVPLAANLSAAQKASRELTGCHFEARLAGAIHMVTINGALTYSNL